MSGTCEHIEYHVECAGLPALPFIFFMRFEIPSLPEDPSHPAQVSLRTYGLALSLALAPGLTPLITTLATARKPSNTQLAALRRLLKREIGLGGFAFAVTVAIGGGSTLKALWDALQDSRPSLKDAPPYKRVLNRLRQWLDSLGLTDAQRTFISHSITSAIAIVLLQTGRHRFILLKEPKPSRTLDLTLLLFVRAADALTQSFVFHRTSHVRDRTASSKLGVQPKPEAIRQRLLKEQHKQVHQEKIDILTTRIDGLVFWACSAR